MESFKRIMGKIGHFLDRHKGWLIFIVLIFIGITAYRYITRSSERKEEMSSGKMTETAAVLLVGHTDGSIDSVSGATERNSFDEVVSFIK